MSIMGYVLSQISDLAFADINSDIGVSNITRDEPLIYLKKLLKNESMLSIGDYISLRERKVYLKNNQDPILLKDIKISGVILLYNSTKKKYYIQKSNNVFEDLDNIRNGKGNKDIFRDYYYDSFSWRVYTNCIDGKEYDSLNEIYDILATKYNVYRTGYNKNDNIKRLQDLKLSKKLFK